MQSTAQPSISELNRFIRQVDVYPVSAKQLQGLARRKKAPRRVVEFYRTFAPDRQFEDREDLAASSEQVEVMRQEESQMPQEDEQATEEF